MDSDEQLKDFCCPICFSCFSEKINIPHILECGHTHCSRCLNNMISLGDKKCGECRAHIAHEHVKFLPVNYSILRLIESLKSKEIKHNEFIIVEESIENIGKALTETQELYKAKIKDLLNEVHSLEKEKTAMKETRETLRKTSQNLGKSKTLTESFSIIKRTMEKMKEIDQQTTSINKRLQKGTNFNCIHDLYEVPHEYVISYHGKLFANYFSRNKKIYMKSLTEEKVPQYKISVDYREIEPFLVKAFVIIDYNNRSSLLEFELFEETNRAKLFSKLCLGACGASFKGYDFRQHDRVGCEGESVTVARAENDDPNAIMKNISKSFRKVDYIKKGYIEGLNNRVPTGSHFRIYFEDRPNQKSQLCFGKLTSGSSILRSALRNQFKVTVKECGLVFDPHLNI